MQRKSFARMECPVARSLEEAGDPWSILVLRNAFLGVRRFHDFQERLGIPPNTLTRRLEVLTKHGLLVRRRYEDHPPREEYELTAKGLDFLPVILSLAAWGTRWLSPNGATIECVDPETGRTVEPMLVDRRTRRELGAGTVALRAGRAASKQLRKTLAQRVVLGAPGTRRAAS